MQGVTDKGRLAIAALGTMSVLACAQVVELVDALASGASVRKDVKVRVLSWAPFLRFRL